MGSFEVILTDAGGNKIPVIKEIRGITNLGLKDAKELVDKAPSIVLEDVSLDEAFKARDTLEAVGGLVEITSDGASFFKSDAASVAASVSKDFWDRDFWDSGIGIITQWIVLIPLVLVLWNFVPDVWDHFFGEEPNTFTSQEWADYVDWCNNNSHESHRASCASSADFIGGAVEDGYEEDCVLLSVQRYRTLPVHTSNKGSISHCR